MRTPTARVRMQRAKPLCASLAITTGDCANPRRVNSSTDHQPSTTATYPLAAGNRTHPSSRLAADGRLGTGWHRPAGRRPPLELLARPGGWPSERAVTLVSHGARLWCVVIYQTPDVIDDR